MVKCVSKHSMGGERSRLRGRTKKSRGRAILKDRMGPRGRIEKTARTN